MRIIYCCQRVKDLDLPVSVVLLQLLRLTGVRLDHETFDLRQERTDRLVLAR